ncbi:hypothetical protein Dimus_009089 [Dionaea muscipula]
MLTKFHNLKGVCLFGYFLPVRLLPGRYSSTKLFVGGLSYHTNETLLRDAFIQHGEIIEVRVICNHVTSNSKGYGFVKFASENAAASALKEMNGQVDLGRGSNMAR